MVNLRLLSWNIRGLNNSLSKRNLRELIYKYKVEVICLQETKIESWTVYCRDSVLDSGQFGLAFQPSIGMSGGLATFWRLSHFKCVALAQATHWIWVTLLAL